MRCFPDVHHRPPSCTPVLLWSGASAPTYKRGCVMPRQWSSTTKSMLVGGIQPTSTPTTPPWTHGRHSRAPPGTQHSPPTTTSCYWWEDWRALLTKTPTSSGSLRKESRPGPSPSLPCQPDSSFHSNLLIMLCMVCRKTKQFLPLLQITNKHVANTIQKASAANSLKPLRLLATQSKWYTTAECKSATKF